MDYKKLLTYGLVGIVGLFLLLMAFRSFDNEQRDWRMPWEQRSEYPTKYFKEKCELAKAFRIYRDHNRRWACKLEDGRVWTQDD